MSTQRIEPKGLTPEVRSSCSPQSLATIPPAKDAELTNQTGPSHPDSQSPMTLATPTPARRPL